MNLGIVWIKLSILDTDVNEFLVRQMSPLFHHQDIELLQVSFLQINVFKFVHFNIFRQPMAPQTETIFLKTGREL